MRTLVICIGDIARGDDGVTYRLAALLQGRVPESVEVLLAPKLDEAVGDELEDASRVVLVMPERRNDPAVESREVEATPAGEFGHPFEPGHLLDIAWSVYAARPHLTLVTVAAPFVTDDIGLSVIAEDAAEAGAREVLRLLGLENAAAD